MQQITLPEDFLTVLLCKIFLAEVIFCKNICNINKVLFWLILIDYTFAVFSIGGCCHFFKGIYQTICFIKS